MTNNESSQFREKLLGTAYPTEAVKKVRGKKRAKKQEEIDA